jgi:hypothetical protein
MLGHGLRQSYVSLIFDVRQNMKTYFGPVYALLLAFFLIGCGSSNGIVSSVGNRALRDFAERAKQLHKSTLVQDPVEIWPESLKQEKPRSVKFYIDGIMIEQSVIGRWANGIYVSWNDDIPYDGSGITFERIDDRIFSYEEKIRN